MKKTYQAPLSHLADMELQEMIAASNNYGNPEAGQDLSTVGTTDATSGNLSRRRDVWMDEMDEEEF